MAPLRGMSRPLIVAAFLLFQLTAIVPAENALRYEVFEELPPETFVGNIITDSHLDQTYQDDILRNFRFEILSGKYKSYFSVDESTGLLRVNRTFDRESECLKRDDCQIDLDIAVVRPIEYFRVIKVKVTILDKNDNSPEFPAGTVTLSIPESSPLGRPGFSIQGARDRDNGILGVQRYDLLTTSSKFGLSSSRNLDGSFNVHIILNESLDHEIQNKYTLQLVAYDGGSPPKSGMLFIDVKVTDTNDNNPDFEQEEYVVTMPEDIQSFTPIVKVKATDPDEGRNGMILYSFATETQEIYGRLFYINNSSGEIFLTRNQGTDLEEDYDLVIQARDLGEDSLRAFAKVHIQVKDVNNHAPYIKINTLTSSGNGEVKENTPRGAFVAHISAEDLDRGHNGLVNCNIQDPNFQLVELYSSEYKIVTTVTFDREIVANYNLVISCQDNGVPSLRSTKNLKVVVLDENDHSPVFTKMSYTESVEENNDLHVPVFKLAATDRDMGNNSKITYSIVDPTSGLRGPPLIEVNPETGVVTTLASFDYERRAQYQFEAIATDGGTPQHTSTATLTLNIRDVNDERPEFSQDAYSFGTFENQSNGTEIGTLSARDLDQPPYNSYDFSLKPVDPKHYGIFDINAVNGRITTKKVLDRETVPAYYLIATVRDRFIPSLSSTASVTIYIADKNDNAPVITYPVENNNTVEVSAYAPIGYIFAKVEAHDLDLGNNAKLKYEIAAGDDLGFFDIDPSVGAVFINLLIHIQERNNQGQLKNHYMLTVLVSDHGSPSLSSSTILHVRINRSEEFAKDAAFVSTSAPFELGYHQKIIIILGAVTAVLVVILVAAIFFVKRRQLQHAKETYRHMHQMDLAKQVAYASPRIQVGEVQSEGHIENTQSQKSKDKAYTASQDGPTSCKPYTCPTIPCYPPVYPSSRTLSPEEDHQERLQGLPLFTKEQDSESTSGCSGDSGHGPSEEGDLHNTSLCHINPGLGSAGFAGSGKRQREKVAPVPPPRKRPSSYRSSFDEDMSLPNSRPNSMHGPQYAVHLGTFHPGHAQRSKANLPDVAQGQSHGNNNGYYGNRLPPSDEQSFNPSTAPPLPKRQPIYKPLMGSLPSRHPVQLPRQPMEVASDNNDDDNMSDCDGASSTSGSFTVQIEDNGVMRSVDV